MFTIYEVQGWGGMEGRTLETDYYNTKENAYNAISKETWNDGVKLYEVVTTVKENGKIVANRTRIARPKTAREIKFNHFDKNEQYID